MTLPPRAEFGRRRVANPPPPGRSSRGRDDAWFATLDRLMGAEPRGPGDSYRIVPIRFVPIVWAAAGLLALHFVDYTITSLGVGAIPFFTTTPNLGDASVSEIASHGPTIGFVLAGLIPILIFLFWNTGHFAAIYAIGAQAPLRWLRWTSPLAFTLAGAASAYVLTAINALAGGHATIRGLIVSLLGGAISGFLYRQAAGVIRIDPADQPQRREATA